MIVASHKASLDEVRRLEDLYRLLEKEMTALHAMWPLADGLPEPVTSALADAITDDDTELFVGTIDGYPAGFLMAELTGLLPQAGGEMVGSIRLVFVEPEAREVGVAEAMRDMAMDSFRARGITRFDAHVLPGHRLVKNFFEAGGFAARSIIMHHRDE